MNADIIQPRNNNARFERLKKEISNPIIKSWILDKEKEQISQERILSDASRLKMISEALKKKYKIEFNPLKNPKDFKEKIREIFLEMGNGKIKKANGEMYGDIKDYSKRYNNFARWLMERHEELPDISIKIKGKGKKPKFVYFTNEQLEKMLPEADYDLRVLMLFLFDTGIRSPKELMNVRASDILNDFKELRIREESSKTFGRRIKLMLCQDTLRKYMKDNNLSGEIPLFPINPVSVNKKLKKIGHKVLGDNETLGRARGKDLTMYDFRHSSACYWLVKYPKESSLKYRFGWVKSDMIYYYTQLLGMSDCITEGDMILEGATKTILEQRVIRLEKENKTFAKAINYLIKKGVIKESDFK